MKAKISRGGGFRGIAEYALGDEKDAEFVAGNVDGQTPRELSAEFALTRQLRPKTPRPVWHCSLSLPEGERLDSERWEAVIHDFLDGMLFDRENHQFFAVRHSDTDYDHVHIIVSRIGLDAGLWHGKWEARKAIELTQELEILHSLKRTPGFRQKDEKSLTKGEIEMAVRTEATPPKKALQGLIKEAAQGNPTVVQFAEKLVMAGVEVRANLASTGTLSGFSFGLDGHSFKGSQLGKKFSWKALKAQGVTYEQDRDREQLERFSGATAGQPTDSNDQRIAVDVGDDQRPVEPVPGIDRSAVEGVFIPANRSDSEQARPDAGHDRTEVVGNPGSGGNRHAKSGLSSDAAGERSGRGSPGSDATRGVESLQRAPGRPSGAGSDDQRSDGATVGRGAAGAGAGSEKSESPEQTIARIDAAFRKALETAGNQYQGGHQGEPKSEIQERPSGAPLVANSHHGSTSVDFRQYADYVWTLADRHTITPERARQAIDAQIGQNPAPERPAGRKAPTGRLSRWFGLMKSKLAKFIDKARDYFNDAAVASAGKGGWSPVEVRSAGMSGDLLNRAEALQLQAEDAADKVRVEDQSERLERTTKAFPSSPDLPQEPGIDLFDDEGDEEVQGPSLG